MMLYSNLFSQATIFSLNSTGDFKYVNIANIPCDRIHFSASPNMAACWAFAYEKERSDSKVFGNHKECSRSDK